MEPEVHIIDRYFQVVLGCLTMTNILLEAKKEIDLLAVHPTKEEFYHVESCVKTTHKLRLHSQGKDDDFSIEYFGQKKFGDYRVERHINGVFNNKPYHKILVVWDVQGDFQDLRKKVMEGCGIEIWLMRGIIYDLSNHKMASGSRDDILRTMELVFLNKKWEKELIPKVKASDANA
jgi:hypothetical protein